MKVCVVGAGTMGRDIAQVFAQKERYTTLLCSSTAASGCDRTATAGPPCGRLVRLKLDRKCEANKYFVERRAF